jgi:hypothetical protein
MRISQFPYGSELESDISFLEIARKNSTKRTQKMVSVVEDNGQYNS